MSTKDEGLVKREAVFSRKSFADDDTESRPQVSKIFDQYSQRLEQFHREFGNALLDLRLFSKAKAVEMVVEKEFVPILDQLAKEAREASGQTRSEIIEDLCGYVMQTSTEDPAFNPVRQAVVGFCFDVGGIEGMDNALLIMEDMVDKAELAGNRFGQIMREELGGDPGDEIVFGMDLETHSIGYFRASELSRNVVLLGPPTDEAYFSKEELAYGQDEYWPVHEALLTGVRQLLEANEGIDKAHFAQFLCKAMEFRSQGFLGDYVDLFEQIGVDIALPALLANLTDPDVLKRRMAVEVLNELGSVEVEGSEMRYLGHSFEITVPQELSTAVISHARRIDPKGALGFFDESGTLVGISSPINVYQPTVEIKAVWADEIFLPKSDEDHEALDRRISLCKGFVTSYDELMEVTYRATGISLSVLSLYEQGLYFSYYANATVDEKVRLQKYLSHYGELGLHVFLALDYGEKSDELFAFTNEHMFPGEQQQELFERLHRLETQVFALRPLLESFQGQDDYPFAAQLHEALVRKTAEYLRVALLVVRGEAKDVDMQDLFKSMETVTRGFEVLADLGSPVEAFGLVEKPQRQAETSQVNPGELITDARTTWILQHKDSSSRVVITVRPQSTERVGNRPGGEARVGAVVQFDDGEALRVSIDVSDYGEEIGDVQKKPVVSLDLGTGPAQKVSGEYPSARIGRLLSALPGSEGGHTEGSFKPEAVDHFVQTARSVSEALSKRFG